MSFIKDNLYLHNELIRIAQGVPNTSEYINKLVLSGLIGKLESNLYSPVSGSDASSFASGRSGTQVFFKDLSSADNFMDFLDANKITYNGARLVYTHSGSLDPNAAVKGISDQMSAGDMDYNLLPLTTKREYVKYPTPTDATRSDFKYWVHKNAVIAFLKEQRQSAQQKPKEPGLMEINLIDKLASEIGKLTGQTINVKSPGPSAKSDLPDYTIVDKFGKKIFMPKSPFTDTGDIPLTLGDLKAYLSFNSWLENGPKAKVNAGTESDWDDSDANKCIILNVLNERALKRRRSATSEADVAKFDQYIKRVQALASGAKCTLSGATAPSIDSSDKSAMESGVRDVVFALPFASSDIDFNRIDRFLAALNKIMPNADYQKAELINTMNIARRQSKSPNIMSLQSGIATITANMSSNPSYTICNYLLNMRSIVEMTAAAVLEFKKKFGSDLAYRLDKENLPFLRRPENKAWYEAVLSQVGGYADDEYGLARQNVKHINIYLDQAGCKGL